MKLSAVLIGLLLLFSSFASAEVSDPFLDQLARAYYIALQGRLDRGEISKGEFETLCLRMMEGLIKAKQERAKLAIELQRLRLEQQRLAIERQRLVNQQQATQAQRLAAIAQLRAALVQRQAAVAQQQAAAEQRATQQYWANWAQNHQQRM